MRVNKNEVRSAERASKLSAKSIRLMYKVVRYIKNACKLIKGGHYQKWYDVEDKLFTYTFFQIFEQIENGT